MPPGAEPGRLGADIQQIEERLAAIEHTARHSVYSMQPIVHFDVTDQMAPVNDQSRARGLDLRLVTTERTLRLNPLICSEIPETNVGPALAQFCSSTGPPPWWPVPSARAASHGVPGWMLRGGPVGRSRIDRRSEPCADSGHNGVGAEGPRERGHR